MHAQLRRGLGAGCGRARMYEEAFVVLDTISRGADLDSDDHTRWVSALKAIQWVIETHSGLALTAAGRRARDDMAAARPQAT